MNSYNELLEYVARGSFRLVRLGLESMGLDGSLRLTEGGDTESSRRRSYGPWATIRSDA